MGELCSVARQRKISIARQTMQFLKRCFKLLLLLNCNGIIFFLGEEEEEERKWDKTGNGPSSPPPPLLAQRQDRSRQYSTYCTKEGEKDKSGGGSDSKTFLLGIFRGGGRRGVKIYDYPRLIPISVQLLLYYTLPLLHICPYRYTNRVRKVSSPIIWKSSFSII